MHLVFELIKSMDEEEADKNEKKAEIRNRNEENRRQIIDFIADIKISDSKSVAKAILVWDIFVLNSLVATSMSLPKFCSRKQFRDQTSLSGNPFFLTIGL